MEQLTVVASISPWFVGENQKLEDFNDHESNDSSIESDHHHLVCG
jgi:hypothetical protein